MSSDLQPVVAQMQFYNYMGITDVSAVMYDYIVTFPSEINYIWNRPWTFVSSVFVVVRYLGLYMAFYDAFYGSPFLPGPVLASTVLLLVREWGFIVFLAGADIVMILRVYSMYDRSRIVLGVLLVFYVATLVLYAISTGYINNPSTYLTMTVSQVLDMSFCNPIYAWSYDMFRLGSYKLIPRLILVGLLIFLAIARFCMESYQTYKATQEWKANRYVKLLTREGILYFLGNLLYMINYGEATFGTLMTMVTTIMMYVLPARFIISVREMHSRQFYEWDKGLDSGFGIGTAQGSSAQLPLSEGFTDEASTTREGDMELREVTLVRNGDPDARVV